MEEEEKIRRVEELINAHVCRFNDGECRCECFIEGLTIGAMEQKINNIIDEKK